MLKAEEVLKFCDKVSFFTGKPSRNCLVEALKLDPKFGSFIKDTMVKGMKFSSADEFLQIYKQSCSLPTNVSSLS